MPVLYCTDQLIPFRTLFHKNGGWILLRMIQRFPDMEFATSASLQ